MVLLPTSRQLSSSSAAACAIPKHFPLPTSLCATATNVMPTFGATHPFAASTPTPSSLPSLSSFNAPPSSKSVSTNPAPTMVTRTPSSVPNFSAAASLFVTSTIPLSISVWNQMRSSSQRPRPACVASADWLPSYRTTASSSPLQGIFPACILPPLSVSSIDSPFPYSAATSSADIPSCPSSPFTNSAISLPYPQKRNHENVLLFFIHQFHTSIIVRYHQMLLPFQGAFVGCIYTGRTLLTAYSPNRPVNTTCKT